jgi:starch phosphorylase
MEREWENLRKLAKWREKVMYNWTNVGIKGIRLPEISEAVVGQGYTVETDIYLGELIPEDVLVEVYAGRVDPSNRFLDRFTRVMKPSETMGDHVYRYRCEIMFEEAGHFGVTVRITPNHPNPESRHAMGLVIWGQM